MTRISIPDDRFDLEDTRRWANGLAKRIVSGAFSWTPGLIPATDEVTTTITTSTTTQVEKLRTTMTVDVTPPSTLDAGLGVTAKWVPASDQLAIRVRNFTAGPITPASGTWLFVAYQT